MIKKILVLVSTLALLVSGLLFTSLAQDDPPPTPQENAAAAADTRQAVFKLLLFNLRPIIGMAQGATFNAELAERNALRIASLAPMIPDLLAEDTRGFDIETEALDLIWDNQDDIADKAQALVEAANAFAATASGGDMGATLGAVRDLGGACANCHDTYRVDND